MCVCCSNLFTISNAKLSLISENCWQKQTRPLSAAAIAIVIGSNNNNDTDNYSNTFKKESTKRRERTRERMYWLSLSAGLPIDCFAIPFSLSPTLTCCQSADCVRALIANHLVKHIGNFWRHFGVLFAVVAVIVVIAFRSCVTFIDPLLFLLLLFIIIFD